MMLHLLGIPPFQSGCPCFKSRLLIIILQHAAGRGAGVYNIDPPPSAQKRIALNRERETSTFTSLWFLSNYLIVSSSLFCPCNEQSKSVYRTQKWDLHMHWMHVANIHYHLQNPKWVEIFKSMWHSLINQQAIKLFHLGNELSQWKQSPHQANWHRMQLLTFVRLETIIKEWGLMCHIGYSQWPFGRQGCVTTPLETQTGWQ